MLWENGVLRNSEWGSKTGPGLLLSAVHRAPLQVCSALQRSLSLSDRPTGSPSRKALAAHRWFGFSAVRLLCHRRWAAPERLAHRRIRMNWGGLCGLWPPRGTLVLPSCYLRWAAPERLAAQRFVSNQNSYNSYGLARSGLVARGFPNLKSVRHAACKAALHGGSM